MCELLLQPMEASRPLLIFVSQPFGIAYETLTPSSRLESICSWAKPRMSLALLCQLIFTLTKSCARFA